MLKKSLILGAVFGALASSAAANPFYIDTGLDFGANGSTTTSVISELGYTGTLATSIYLGNPAVVGTPVIDTNIAATMGGFGFVPGARTALDGTALTFFLPSASIPGFFNIDALNFVAGPTDGNGFTGGTGGCPLCYGGIISNGAPLWGLTYQYTISGVTTATGVSFTSGFFDVFYEDGTSTIQVLRLNVTGSALNAANLDIFGNVTYDWDGDGLDDDASAFAKAFFVDAATNTTFYSNWVLGFPPENLSVSWKIDTNVNPPLPTVSQLNCTAPLDATLPTACTGPLIRQTTLDGSVTFAVPEPGVLLLFGVGLLGLALTRKVLQSKA